MRVHELRFDDYDLDCLLQCLRLSASVTGDRLIAEVERQCPDRVPFSATYPNGLGNDEDPDGSQCPEGSRRGGG